MIKCARTFKNNGIKDLIVKIIGTTLVVKKLRLSDRFTMTAAISIVGQQFMISIQTNSGGTWQPNLPFLAAWMLTSKVRDRSSKGWIPQNNSFWQVLGCQKMIPRACLRTFRIATVVSIPILHSYFTEALETPSQPLRSIVSVITKTPPWPSCRFSIPIPHWWA